MTLVVGATGLLGGEICRLLRERREAVRGLVRAGSPRSEALARDGVECVEGDLKSPDSLRHACRGVRTVVSTANSALSRRKGDSIQAVDLRGHLNLVDAARSEGVTRFIFLSVMPSLSRAAPFVRAKRQVEWAVRSSGMTWTILQPAPFMEISFSKLAGWDLEAGTVTLLGPGTNPVAFVSYRDVAATAVLALEDEVFEGQSVFVGGPERITTRDAVRAFEEALGRPLRVRSVPLGMVRLLAAISAPFHPILSSLMTMGVETSANGDSHVMLGDLSCGGRIEWTTVAAYARSVARGGP